MFTAPHVMLVPGAAVTITVTGFNLIGEASHEALSPDAMPPTWF